MKFRSQRRFTLHPGLEARVRKARAGADGAQSARRASLVRLAIVMLLAGLIAIGSLSVAFFSGKEAPIPTLPPPRAVPRFRQPFLAKGVYLPADVAARPQRVEATIELINRTELNAVVIDVKDSTGLISYESNIGLAQEIGSASERITGIQGVLEQFHANSIYVIGRIAVFQDPILAQAHPEWAIHSRRTGGLWKDHKGLSWIDPAAQPAWIYNAEVAEEASRLGFDEMNFDYIRFPSDGPLDDMVFPAWEEGSAPKYEVIKQFFRYLDTRLHTQVRPSLPISADIFGMTFWKKGEDDLNIGQRVEDALPHFDYIQPMLYPSHFPPLFDGFKNPAQYPFEIVSRSLARKKALFESSRAKPRPWLQDFDLGAFYTAELVRAQINAAQSEGAFGWIFWNPAGVYTKEAFTPEPQE